MGATSLYPALAAGGSGSREQSRQQPLDETQVLRWPQSNYSFPSDAHSIERISTELATADELTPFVTWFTEFGRDQHPASGTGDLPGRRPVDDSIRPLVKSLITAGVRLRHIDYDQIEKLRVQKIDPRRIAQQRELLSGHVDPFMYDPEEDTIYFVGPGEFDQVFAYVRNVPTTVQAWVYNLLHEVAVRLVFQHAKEHGCRIDAQTRGDAKVVAMIEDDVLDRSRAKRNGHR